MINARSQVLVTGGAGFIGSHVVEDLLRNGFRVNVLDDFSTGKLANLPQGEKGLKIVEGNILDRKAVRSTMKDCNAVIHLAAIASVQQSIDEPVLTHQVNFDGTLLIIEEAKRHGINRVIYASSAAVYGEVLQVGAINERTPPAPMTPYAIDKLAGEYYLSHYARNYGIEYTACRFFNVYGPRQSPSSPYSGVISIFVDKASGGSPLTIYGDGLQTRDFVYVKDVAHILVDLIGNKKSFRKSVNVGNGISISLLELAEEVGAASGAQIDLVFKEARQGDIRHSLADVSLLHEIIECVPGTPLHIGLSEVVHQ